MSFKQAILVTLLTGLGAAVVTLVVFWVIGQLFPVKCLPGSLSACYVGDIPSDNFFKMRILGSLLTGYIFHALLTGVLLRHKAIKPFLTTALSSAALLIPLALLLAFMFATSNSPINCEQIGDIRACGSKYRPIGAFIAQIALPVLALPTLVIIYAAALTGVQVLLRSKSKRLKLLLIIPILLATMSLGILLWYAAMIFTDFI